MNPDHHSYHFTRLTDRHLLKLPSAELPGIIFFDQSAINTESPLLSVEEGPLLTLVALQMPIFANREQELRRKARCAVGGRAR